MSRSLGMVWLLLAVVLLAPPGAAAQIRQGPVVLSISDATGQASELLLRGVWKKKLNVASSFAVYTHGEGETAGAWHAFETFKLIGEPAVDARAGTVRSAYRADIAGGPVRVTTTITVERDATLRFRIDLDNGARKPILRVRYPELHNLSFTPGGTGDEMLWPFFTTVLVTNPRKSPQKPLHYPRACVNYMDLSGGGQGLALIGSPSLVMNEFAYGPSKTPGAIDMRIDMVNAIAPGAKATYEFIAQPHGGDWHAAADYYRAWFYRHFPQPDYPSWAKYTNGYLSVMWGTPFPPPYGRDTRLHINEAWRLGLDHLQFWGQTGNHACPGYPLPDPLRGGEEAFTKMFKRIRDAGLHTGGYFWSNGMSKFLVQTKSFRGVPWEEYSKALRPPSWDWLVKNSLYATPERTPPSKQITSNGWKRAKVKTIAEAEAKKLSPQSLHPMSYHSPEFRDWLGFWVSRYVKQYGADTPYLDVFGCRPKFVEHNQYLNKFGDGTEGKLRYAFLTGLKTLRAGEKDLNIMVEGCIDAYNIHAPALISNRRRFLEGYRYTFPRLILYEGLGNGRWAPDKSVAALSQAYLDGNRFDLMLLWLLDEGERIVWLREPFIKWIAEGTYMGSTGLKLSSDKVQASRFDAVSTLGSSLINFRNYEKTEGVTLTLPARLRSAHNWGVLLPLWGEATVIEDLRKPIAVPATTVSSLVLVKSEARRPLVFVLPEMTPRGLRYAVRLVNLSDKETPVKATVTFVEKQRCLPVWDITLKPRQIAEKAYVLPSEWASDRVERLLFSFASGDDTVTLRRTYTPLAEDPGFEWNPDWPRTDKVAIQGTYSLAVAGGTREKVYLKLAPNCKYELSVAVRKTAGSVPDVIVWDPRYRKVVTYLRGGSSLKPDTWGRIKADFTTEKDGGLYLRLAGKGKDTVCFDDVQLRAKP